MDLPRIPMSHHRLLSRPFPSLAAALLCAPLLPAQVPTTDEQTIELSPFVISAGTDTGYAAQNTLSGTRTRTDLKDVASAISVFTRDFMNDLAATTEDDILAYSAAAVPELTDQTANVQGISIIQPNNFQYRFRGQTASRTRDYFETLNPPDTYNLDRFEESRGPNAILFGLGGAGGILNQSTKRARTDRNETTATATVASHSSTRVELDHNQVLLADKFALRLNALYQDDDGWRPYELARTQRIHLAGTFVFSRRAELRLEFEDGSIADTVSRDFGSNDNVSLWLEQGRTTTTGSAANAAAGITRTANQQTITVIGNDGSVRNFQQTAQSTTDTARLGAAITDPSLVPFDAFVPGPGSERQVDFRVLSAFLEVQPVDKLFLEFAINRQDSTSSIYDTTNGVYQLYGEPSAVYRDGEANPYAGDLYFTTRWVNRSRDETLTNLRATGAYTLDLQRAGRHQFAVMAQRSRDSYFQNNLVPVLAGSPFNSTPSNNRNQINTRAYITDPTDLSQYAVASWRTIPSQINVVLDKNGPVKTYDTAWITNREDISDDRTDITSYLASVQSYFFDDRLVTTVGARRDTRKAFTHPTMLDADSVAEVDYATTDLTVAEADQASIAVVGHLTPWVSVIYNQSQNAQIPGSLTTLIPDASLLPISRGKGRDAGLSFTLAEGKFYARIAYFETEMTNAGKAFNAGPNTSTRNDRILDTMITDNLLTTAQADARRITGEGWDLLDRRTTGWELNVTANPTPNWRILFNGSKSKSVEDNMLKRTRLVMDDLLATWATANAASITANSISVAQEITDFHTWFDTNTSVQGKSSLGDREWQLKAFNRYDFADGPLKGFYLGGGLRYQSAPIIGADPVTGALFAGEAVTEMDVLLGYKRRISLFGLNTHFSLQLNGRNLLQQHDYLSLRQESTGQLSVVRLVEPATWSLQARFSF